MARGMVDVELVGDGPSGGGPDPLAEWLRRCWAAGVRAWRRPRVRWVALGVVVTLVAVPVAVHAASAAHERARLAALAQVPGVVRPLHPGLRAVLRVADPDAQALKNGSVVGGSLVSVENPPNGEWSIVGLDPTTGERRWSTGLPPVGVPADTVELPGCAPAGGAVFCTATQVGDVARHVWRTSTWVLDPADGHVIRAAAYDEHTWATVAGGLAVVARQSSGPSRAPATGGPWDVTWEVTGSDAATGAVRWTWTSPVVTVSAAAEAQNDLHSASDYYSSFGGVSRWPSTADVALDVGDDTWVLGPDGSELTHVARPGGWHLWEEGGSLLRTPRGRDFDTTAESPLEELLTAGGTWLQIAGDDPWLLVDDGSAPDVLLRASGLILGGGRPALSGVDRHTGATLWQTPLNSGPGLTAMLLRGRVYVGAETLQAIDVATGRTIWSTTSDDGAGGSLVATDGSVLLVAPPSAHNSELEARSLDDGRVLWREDVSAAVLPSGTGNVTGIGTLPALGRLGATRLDGSVVVLG